MIDHPMAGADSPNSSFTRDLRALHDISMELSAARDADELCERAVRLGKSILNFDRISIWFIDRADPSWNVGTWGTDEYGEVRDERAARVRRDPLVAPPEFYQGKIPLVTVSDGVVYNHRREPVGRADSVLAPLWDGRRIVGELSVDNLIRHHPFTSERLEVIVVFARIIAHLSSLKRVEAELRALATTDSLTNAVNRRTALILLEKQVGAAIRTGGVLTISILDIDGLKRANDTFGHAEGDAYIKSVCGLLLERVRASDTVGRLGGDEFLVIFPDCPREEADRIMGLVATSVGDTSDRSKYRRAISYGVATVAEIASEHPFDSSDVPFVLDRLIELADRRMYEQKRRQA